MLRKANCLVLLATQSLSDAARSGILDVLTESCATKIFLPNPNAREESATALYQGMGLNARQIEIIASATPKRHYYYVSEQGRRLYELALGPIALAFCGASGKEDLERIRKLQAQFGDGWVEHWLNARGVSLDRLEARGGGMKLANRPQATAASADSSAPIHTWRRGGPGTITSRACRGARRCGRWSACLSLHDRGRVGRRR